MTETEIEEFVSHLSGVIEFRTRTGGPAAPERAEPGCKRGSRTRNGSAAARHRLVEAGYAPDLVKTFPPMQVILVDEKRDYEIQRDERMKLLALPLWQIDSCMGGEEQTSDGDGLFADLLPHIIKLRRTQGQLEQQIALLRHVEALRMYAAEHDGKLPAKLSDFSVPLPIDPVTGKPFDYAVDRSDRPHSRQFARRRDVKDPGSQRPLRGDSPEVTETPPAHAAASS